MTELIAVVVVLLLFYGVARAWAKVQIDKVAIWATKQSVANQTALRELDEQVEAVKKTNGGKWFSIDSINEKMQ